MPLVTTARLFASFMRDIYRKASWATIDTNSGDDALFWVENYKNIAKDDSPILKCLHSDETLTVTPSFRPTFDAQAVMSLFSFAWRYPRFARRAVKVVGGPHHLMAVGGCEFDKPTLLASLFSDRTVKRMFKAYCVDLQLSRQLAKSQKRLTIISRHVSDPLLALIGLSRRILDEGLMHYVVDHSALKTQLPLSCLSRYADLVFPKTPESREMMLSWPKSLNLIGAAYGDPRLDGVLPLLEPKPSRPLITLAFTDNEAMAGFQFWNPNQRMLLFQLTTALQYLGFEVAYRAKMATQGEATSPALWPSGLNYSLEYLLKNSSYALVVPAQKSGRVSSILIDFLQNEVPAGVLASYSATSEAPESELNVPNRLRPLILRGHFLSSSQMADGLKSIQHSYDDMSLTFVNRGLNCHTFNPAFPRSITSNERTAE